MISTRGGFAARARQDRWHQQMRGVVAEALRGDRVRRHAVLDQFGLDRVGAADRQTQVVLGVTRRFV
jgi:hypothetical protein